MMLPHRSVASLLRTLAPCAPAVALAAIAAAPLAAQRDAYRSPAFVVTDTSVRQGRFEAVARGRDTIVSTYPRSGREMHFRFSLNGADNEFRSGTEHTLYVRPRRGRIESPLYVFGQEQPPFLPTPEATEGSEEGMAEVTLRLDLREVMRAFERAGVYDPPEGPPIRREDFRAVYAIGDVEPLSWDHRVLRPGSPAQLRDEDGDGIFTLTIPVEAQYTRPQAADGRALWARRADLAAFPQLASDGRLVDALYRMSLEELTQLVREDGALSAGAKWPGVWTRDESYAAVLALVLAAPDAVRRSLLAKVDSAGRIIQDTGTGGSWPVSTDRMTWALAAWELYAATGDRDWLRRAYDAIARSAEADRHAAFDRATGLYLGETSFMDWREQSYPRWMDPRDIAQSQALGTNVVHLATRRILADMARDLGEPGADAFDAEADALQAAIDRHFHDGARGGYATFRYGRLFPAAEPRRDALGEALAVIYGAADEGRRARLVETAPRVPMGVPTFWPYIPGIPAYHNATLWPFVGAYSTWAAAEAGNTAAVEHGLATLLRPAALFLTNKENMVASTGHFDGTELNSDRQLWSVAGNLAASYRILFGMRLHPDRLAFRPMVPPGFAGTRTLSNLRYRGAVLTITVRGHGDGVAAVRVDGRPVERAEVPASLTGAHRVEIEMNGRWPASTITVVENRFTPGTPVVTRRGGTLRWDSVAGAERYLVHRDGLVLQATRETSFALFPELLQVTEWQVAAVDSAGLRSFLSEPLRMAPEGTEIVVRPAGATEREHAGFSGEGYLTLTRERNTTVEVPVRVACGGTYLVEARYANGTGPINTDANAAVRTLLADGAEAGVLVMPQRGVELWTEWGWSTGVRLRLAPGDHTLTLAYTPLDENMGRRVSTALLDHLRLTRLPGDGGACR
jgi:hypothetical protein